MLLRSSSVTPDLLADIESALKGFQTFSRSSNLLSVVQLSCMAGIGIP